MFENRSQPAGRELLRNLAAEVPTTRLRTSCGNRGLNVWAIRTDLNPGVRFARLYSATYGVTDGFNGSADVLGSRCRV